MQQMDSHQTVPSQQHVCPQWCVPAGGSAVWVARAEDVSEVDVGAAQEVGFVNKQRVQFTVGEIERVMSVLYRPCGMLQLLLET